MEIVSLINVTAPVWAKARPHPSVTPLFIVMLVLARIFPIKVVFVSNVAELPTFQYRPAPEAEPTFTMFTFDPGM